METARDGKTYVLTDLDVQLPNKSQCDQICAKLDMGSAPMSSLAPLRTYKKMFLERLLGDGSPDKHIQPWFWMQQRKHHQTPGIHHSGHRNTWQGTHLITIFISEHHEQILIGHPSCDQLGAYTVHVNNLAPQFDQTRILPEVFNVSNITIRDVADLKRQYRKQFDVIGNFEGEYNIVTDPVLPVQHAMRKTPIEYQEKIDKELDWMVEQGIIAPVTEPTEWVNLMSSPMFGSKGPEQSNHAGILQTPKPGRNHTQTEWSNCLLQAWCLRGFFAYRLNYKSSLKTTFNTTPRCCRYRYLYMPMGGKSSQEAYQMKINQILEGLEGHDDITVFGKWALSR